MAEAYHVLIRPILTEKSERAQQEGKYQFQVACDANKHQIRKVIEAQFNVRVESVRVMNIRGKRKRRRLVVGKRPNWKKAIVQLAEGQSMTIFENA